MFDDAFVPIARRISAIPELTKDEEAVLVRRWKDRRDQSAADELIRANLRLALTVAYKFKRPRLYVSDLFGEGVLGLMRALELYTPDHGTRFSSYAYFWVRNYIFEYVKKGAAIVSPSHNNIRMRHMWEYRRERERLRALYSDDSSRIEAEMATTFKCSVGQIRTVLEWGDTMGRRENELFPEFDGKSMSRHTAPPTADLDDVDIPRLMAAIASLPVRQRSFVTYYYLHEMTVTDIAAMFKITHQAVSQQLHKGFDALVTMLTGDRSPVGAS